MKIVLAVAVGGAIGAVARYLAMTQIGHWLGTGFPWSTVIVNVVGCFIMGALVELMALVWSPGETLRALLTVGILGGFTTFSTFALDVGLLVSRNATFASMGYVLASVGLSIVGFYIGLHLVRAALA